MPDDAPLLSRNTSQGRGALAALILGSAVTMLDGTVVNIALPTMGRELGASFGQLQWVVNGYMLALASLVLTGGSLGDHLGRRRVYLVGVSWFAIASVLCAMAPGASSLIAARVLQGVAGALLTPGALAIIQSSFRPPDRAAAIGTWAGLSGVATAIGPFLGGWLLQQFGWRSIFAINVPLVAVVILLTLRFVPAAQERQDTPFDVPGTVLAVLGLGGTTYALTGLGSGLAAPTLVAGLVGVLGLVGFVVVQRRSSHPQLPLWLFGSRVFSAANAMTFLVYGALATVMFLLGIQLQETADYSPMAAGLAGLPITGMMMLFSSRAAALGARVGPRLPMTVGPLLCAAGVLLLATIGDDAPYWQRVFPGVLVFAVGLTALVSPLTAAVLAAAPGKVAGVASGVNNAVARSGSLLAVAALPPLAGITGTAYQDPVALTHGYRLALFTCAGLMAAGGLVSWFGLKGSEPAVEPA